MKKSKTSRGFSIVNFEDYDYEKCSLQQSSLATESCIWLGVDDPNPKVLAKDAEKFGVNTIVTEGWVDFPVPRDVSINTRMHLNREQVEDLVGCLNNWLKKGEF